MSLFDAYMMVDWSARSKPSPAKPVGDAIYVAFGSKSEAPKTRYYRTRVTAAAAMQTLFNQCHDRGERLLAGFDFPFGYPKGFARGIGGADSVFSVWKELATRIEDNEENANNRFDVAADLNRMFDGVGPFWGRPNDPAVPDLPSKGTARQGTNHPPERRVVETHVKSAQPCWKLYTTGSVGSQALLGIPILQAFRKAGPHIRVWPFEDVSAAPVVLAEIYPSLFDGAVKLLQKQMPGVAKDALQVAAAVQYYADADKAGILENMLAVPAAQPQADQITNEEGWILGVTP
ncbi:MAG: hypothetical protein AAFR98_01845 [Pseudomonadota bacterium]